MLSYTLLLPLITVLLIATWIDIRQQRIPNLTSIGGALLGLVLNAVVLGWGGVLSGLYGVGLGLLVFLPLYALGGMGAGDVKLLAMIGAFLGPIPVLLTAAVSLLVSIPLALIYAAVRGQFRLNLSRYGLMFKTFCRTLKVAYIPPAEGDVMAMRFPYALALLVGTLIALLVLSPPGAPLGLWR
jgi:prepilin peptidase CpaA